MATKQVNVILDFKALYYVYCQSIGNMYKKKFGYFMESTMYSRLEIVTSSVYCNIIIFYL